MDSWLDRAARLDAERTIAAAAALLIALVVVAWVVAAVSGRWEVPGLAAAIVAALIAAIGLLYAFELGTPSRSSGRRR